MVALNRECRDSTWRSFLSYWGFGRRSSYGFAVFSLFWMLDRDAAPQEKKTITKWFTGPKYDKAGVSAVIVYVFDLLYTQPLWGWRAILRSILISLILTVLVAFHLFPMTFRAIWVAPEIGYQALFQACQNIASDYFSLFFIRRWLILAGERPIFALTTAPAIGLLIVALCYAALDIGNFSISVGEFHWRYFREDFWQWYRFIYNQTMRWSLLVPALLVHLWLPLFALGVLIAQLLNSVRVAGRFSQWFFAEGEAHPLRSIGYIAGAATALLMAVAMAIPR